MAQRPPTAWMPMASAMVAGALVAGVIGWRLSLRTLDTQIVEKRKALKRLTITGGLPPTQEVLDHLKARGEALRRQLQLWQTELLAAPIPSGSVADPQVYFQERSHEVQQTLERLAAGRKMPTPELLGFPKELPPSETVPRLLVQLDLIQDAAELMFEHEVEALVSFKIDDPEVVEEAEGRAPFLQRLPIRVRFASPLRQLLQIVKVVDRATPRVDVRSLRLTAAEGGSRLDAELVLARYLPYAPSAAIEGAATEERGRPSASERRSSRRKRR